MMWYSFKNEILPPGRIFCPFLDRSYVIQAEGNVINLSTQLLRAFYVFGKFG